MSADRLRRGELRGYDVRWRAHQDHGDDAAGCGAAAGGVSAGRSAGEGRYCAAEAVYRPGAAARGEEAGDSASGPGDCDLRHGGGTGRGEWTRAQGQGREEDSGEETAGACGRDDGGYSRCSEAGGPAGEDE